MSLVSSDLMCPDTGNPYHKYKGIIYVIGFHIDQESRTVREFFADRVGPCEIHSCSRSNKSSRRGLYVSLKFKYEEDAKRAMAEYQNQSVKGSRPLTILWYCDRDTRLNIGSTWNRQISTKEHQHIKRRRTDTRYSNHFSNRNRGISSSRSRSASVTKSPRIRSSYATYDREKSHTPLRSGSLMSYNETMDPLPSHTQLESYPVGSLSESLSHQSVITEPSTHEIIEPVHSLSEMDSVAASQGIVCTDSYSVRDDSVDLRLMLSCGIQSHWMDGRQELGIEKNLSCIPSTVKQGAELEDQSTEPFAKKGRIAFKIKSSVKSPSTRTPVFEYGEAENLEPGRHTQVTLEDSLPDHQTKNYSGDLQRWGFVPIQSYEGNASPVRGLCGKTRSPALHDAQEGNSIDASVQCVDNIQEQPSMDISPIGSVDGNVDINQQLLYTNRDDNAMDALSALLKRRSRLEQAFHNDCHLLAQSVEIFTRHCPEQQAMLMSVLRSTLNQLSMQVTKKMEQYAQSLLTATVVDKSTRTDS